MNILFISENEINPMQGGTEHITHTLSSEFRKLGHRCTLAYFLPIDGIEPTPFDGKIKLDMSQQPSNQILPFLTDNHIDFIIVNLVRYASKQWLLPSLFTCAHQMGAKIMSCYHAMPGEDLLGTNISNAVYRIIHKYDVKQAIKDIVLQILPSSIKHLVFGKRMKAKYRLQHKYADKLVLLSPQFYQPYAKLAQIDVDEKFCHIANALSFGSIADNSILKQKEKKVLIVARIHEHSKRLSSALKIWKEIEQNAALSDWRLQIVGSGPDMNYYKQMLDKLELKRCSLLGRQPSIEPFYQKASLFMMTSSYEGFGITLTEAQQFGVVPIVFNSYASLSDIIENDQTGIIVDNNDIKSFAEKMTSLMLNNSKREEMAIAALNCCKQFSQDCIVQQWMDLFDQTKKSSSSEN